MRSKLVGDDPRTWALVFDTDDEAARELLAFARDHAIHAARFQGIGAFGRATLAFFDVETRRYDPIPVDEQVEVVSLLGNVARFEGEPRIHAHVVVSRRDGTTLGGHLVEGWVRPTLEVLLVASPVELSRDTDAATGLPLLRP